MSDSLAIRIKARLRGLLPTDWMGKAGDQFRKTLQALGAYSKEHIRPEERLEELPDLAWNRVRGEADEKYSQAMLNFAKEESTRIENEAAKRVAEYKLREASASADESEAEARLAQTNELMARINLADRLKQTGLLPIWDESGKMIVVRAPSNLDWDELTARLISTEQLVLPEETHSPEKKRSKAEGSPEKPQGRRKRRPKPPKS